jgi:hypothetical protein
VKLALLPGQLVAALGVKELITGGAAHASPATHSKAAKTTLPINFTLRRAEARVAVNSTFGVLIALASVGFGYSENRGYRTCSSVPGDNTTPVGLAQKPKTKRFWCSSA